MRPRLRVSPSVGFVALTGAACVAAWTVLAAPVGGQTPTFRAAVDLIAVDVQVIDDSGRPIPTLSPDDFAVTIAGKRRRIATVDYIESAPVDGPSVDAGIRPTRVATATNAAAAARTYVLAFDTNSFSNDESRDVVAAAKGFIRQLQPEDRVGVYTFPTGPRQEPTTDHLGIIRLVDTITGGLQRLPGEFNMSAAEIIDINSENNRSRSSTTATAQPTSVLADTGATGRVQLRECGTADLNASPCFTQIREEAMSLAAYLEGRIYEGLTGLRSLLTLLDQTPGRKAVVLLSAGMPVSDRPGGRPDVGDLGKVLGQAAAATNTIIYALQVDRSASRQMAAETRRADRMPVATGRDSIVNGRLLSEFSAASGGALIRVLMGGGEVALGRVLRETASHYLLGVEPSQTDRDGKMHDLRVKVTRKGATVRSRSWVKIPARPQG